MSRLSLWRVCLFAPLCLLGCPIGSGTGGGGARVAATNEATGHRATVFNWSLEKSASPDALNLANGQSGTVQFTISATKTPGGESTYVDGQVCVTNDGDAETTGLTITVEAGQYSTTLAVDVAAKPTLAPGETYCYPYRLTGTSAAGAYQAVAHVAITNYGGQGGGGCIGPSLAAYSIDSTANFTLPGTPDVTTNDTIHVNDTDGQAFTFSDSGSQSFNKDFTCSADAGQQTDTATIAETGQTASASVTVACLCTDPRARQSGPIALSCDNSRLVNVNSGQGTITLFDATQSVPVALAEIPVGADPSSVAIHPDNVTAYVANAQDGTVSVVDLDSRAVTKTIAVGAEPLAVAVSPLGTRLYVANSSSNSLMVIDTASAGIVANLDLSPFGTAPRAIAVTNNGNFDDADETIFVAMFYAQLRAGKSSLDEGQDDEREGRVVAIEAASNTVLAAPNPIVLAPLANAGFNSNGQLAPAPSQVPAVASANPQTFTTPTGCYPNQLAAIAIRPGSTQAYVVSTAASPNGPLRFNQMAQGLVSLFDTATRAEITAGQADANVRRTAPLNLNQGVNLATTPTPRLFMTNPVGMAWRPDGSDAWIAVQNSDVLVRLTVDGNGVPTVGAPLAAGASAITRVDLQTQPGLETDAEVPRGIVIDSDGHRAFVSNFISRTVTAIDISNATSPAIAGSARSANLPAAGTDAATIVRGAALFFTGRGPQGRMSSDSWGGCIVCHPGGRSDNVTWMFDAGPRQTISLDGTFNKTDPHDQRILNWSAVRDENQDFELNTRGVFSGRGLIDDDRLFFALGGTSGATPTDSSLIEQFQQATGAVGVANDLAAAAALPGISARRDFGLATTDDDLVYIIGGRTGNGTGSLVSAADAVLEFDPRTNAITPRNSTGFTIRHSLGAAAVRTSAGVRIYAIGGYNSTADGTPPNNIVEEYDPATGIWRTVAPLLTAVAQFGTAVAGGTNTAEPLQLIHVVFGNVNTEAAPLVSNANPVQRFQADPAGPGTWSGFNPAGLTPRSSLGAAAVTRGVQSRIFAIGGIDGTGAAVTTVEEYLAQAVTLVATPHTALPDARAAFGIGSSRTAGQIYVMGGVNGAGADQTTIFELTVATNGPTAGPSGTPSGAWVTRGDLSVARRGLAVSTPPGVTNFLTAASGGRDERQDAIAAWVAAKVRPGRAPLPASDAHVANGRTLFGQEGLVVAGFSCATCHGGPKWTRSTVDYTPPPSPEIGLGLGDERVIGAELRQTGLQGANPGQFPGVLVNVGTFTLAGRVNEVRTNPADVSQAIAPLGANGLNIPSLLSVHETAPYFYSGLAQTLEEVLNGSQDNNGGTRHHFIADPNQRADLISFLRSIDDTTPVFP